MRGLLILAITALVFSCAHTKDHWGDDEDTVTRAPKKEPLKPETSGPPVSFVVASEDEGEGTGDALDKVKHDATVSKAAPAEDTSSESIPVVTDRKPKEIPVVVEKPKAEPTRLKVNEDEFGDPVKPAPRPEDLPKPKKGADTAIALETSSPDPFRKLDRDLARNEPPPSKTAKAEPTVVAAANDEAASEPPPPPKKSNRDPRWMGLTILAGAGVLASHETIPDYGYHLAYGGQLAWNPAFAGDFALDVGFWRSTRSQTTGFSSTDSTSNYATVRIMFLPKIVAGFYLGLGVGGLASFSQVHYRVATSVPYEAEPGALHFGGDGTVAFGYRWRFLEARIDLRTLLHQGYRLEFLPTGSIGATF